MVGKEDCATKSGGGVGHNKWRKTALSFFCWEKCEGWMHGERERVASSIRLYCYALHEYGACHNVLAILLGGRTRLSKYERGKLEHA